jgi:hypothetical protein
MATCQDCKLEMTNPTVKACTHGGITLNGLDYERIRFAAEPAERCHDCYVVGGGLHHYGCDLEECPRCHGQLVACNCRHAHAPHRLPTADNLMTLDEALADPQAFVDGMEEI